MLSTQAAYSVASPWPYGSSSVLPATWSFTTLAADRLCVSQGR